MLRGQVMDIMIALRRISTCKSAPANFDVMGGPGGGAIVRGKSMNSPVFLADSDHLAPAMNDVDINTVCHGDLGDRRATTCAFVIVLYRRVPALALVTVSN